MKVGPDRFWQKSQLLETPEFVNHTDPLGKMPGKRIFDHLCNTALHGHPETLAIRVLALVSANDPKFHMRTTSQTLQKI